MNRKTAKNPKGGGRPRIPLVTPPVDDLTKKLPPRPIILEQVMYWMDLGAPAEEIAGSFHVSVDTLVRRLKELTGLGYAELKERCCGPAKIKLRNNQFKMSEHNASMAIWLGKIWLGQSDVNEVKDLVADVVRDTIREIAADKGISDASRSSLEAIKSILDQGHGRQEGQVQTELGAEDSTERSPSLQDSSESSSARDNNVFLPPFPG